jgi:uncharacterized membrane protein YeaQ/YmgE (transglycosylase-associated protein family)
VQSKPEYSLFHTLGTLCSGFDGFLERSIMGIVFVLILLVLAVGVFSFIIGSLISALFTVLAGALIGWLASIIMGVNHRMGALANVVAGLVGAFIGGIISRLLISASYGVSFHPLAILFGVIGACIAIALYKVLMGGGRTATLR